MKSIPQTIKSSIQCYAFSRVGLFSAFFLSALLCSLGQPDRHYLFSLMAYLLGFPLFFVALRKAPNYKWRTLYAFLWGIIVSGFQIQWLATTHYHGGWILLAYGALVLWMASQWSWMGFLLPHGRLQVFHCVALASFWALIEWGRLFTLSGFPFAPVGLVLSYDAVPLQLASIIGIYGLSFWVIYAGVLGAMALETRRTYMTWMVVVLLPFVFGSLHLNYHRVRQADEGSLNIALVQTGLMPDEKYELPGWENTQKPPWEQYERVLQLLENQEISDLDLLVLPEAAFPYNITTPVVAYDDIKEWFTGVYTPALVYPLAHKEEEGPMVTNGWLCQALANKYRCEVIVGLSDTDNKPQRHYNAAFHYLPYEDAPNARYEKRVLVPISEYLPFNFLSKVATEYGITNHFTHGSKSKVFVGKQVYAPSICYEEGFPYLVRQGRLQGANLLVNLTNDAWFPKSRLAQEHFNIGRVRAVENGVSLVRACNSGVSAIVDCFGNVVSQLPEQTKDQHLASGVLHNSLNTYNYTTWYTRCGDGPILLFSMVMVFLFLGRWALHLRNKNIVR